MTPIHGLEGEIEKLKQRLSYMEKRIKCLEVNERFNRENISGKEY